MNARSPARFDIDLAAALGLALLTPLLIARLSPRPASPPQRRKASLAELGLRMLAGATLVSVIASAAHVVGTRWSGLLTISPIATSVLAAGSRRSAGADQAVHLLRGLGAGLYSLTAFFAALALLIVRGGTAWAFGAAVLAALTAQLILLIVLDQELKVSNRVGVRALRQGPSEFVQRPTRRTPDCSPGSASRSSS